jgi:signal transduction histidine kinase
VNFTQGGGRVCLSAVRANGAVRVVVSDNGPGVAPQDLDRIMEPFEQAARGIAEHAQGAGLGLPLAKALAELHGGTLTIASTHGEGFTATLELPLG